MQARTVLMAFLILGSYFCTGQTAVKKISHGGVGFSVIPFGRNTVWAMPEDEELGRGVYTFSKTPFYAGNLYGFFNIKKNTRLVIGFGYSYSEIFATEEYDDGPYYYHRNIKVFTIPIYIEKTFFKYIFITYGGIVNIESNYVYDHYTRIDKQSGVGLITSLGGTYRFKSGINVFAGPTVFIYTLFGSGIILNDKVAGIGAEFGLSVDL
jgi:hypothetical protein